MSAPPAERLAVEETVRRFFTASEAEDLSTGPLRDLQPLIRELGAGTRRTGLELRRLAAVEVDTATATVDLAAVAGYERRDDGRLTRWRARYSGPVKLLRLEDGWKVADYKLDGRSVVGSLHAVAGEPAESEGVVLRPRGALLHRRATMVYFEIENRRDDDVDVRAASNSLCYCGATPTRVHAGARTVARVSWPKRRSLRTRELAGRLYARERRSKKPFDFAWRIDLRKKTAAATASVRPSPALRLYSRLGDNGFILGLAALGVAVGAASDGVDGALGYLLLAAALFVFMAFSSLREYRRLRAVVYVVGAAALLALWSVTRP